MGPGGQSGARRLEWGPEARGARRPEARGPQADYMRPTRDLETPSSAADVCSLYADKSAEKQSKVLEARRLTTSIPHAICKVPKQTHSPQMCF